MIHRYAVTKSEKRFIDKAAYVVGVMFPLSTIPQVVQLFTTQDASGLSLATWAMYVVLTGLFLIYAIVDNIKPLVFTQIAWLIVDATMVYGILAFR